MAKLRYFGKEIYYDETKIDINTNFVVYKINFNDLNKFYIGEVHGVERTLNTRLHDHFKDARTKKGDNLLYTILNCSNNISVEIIKKCKDAFETEYMEKEYIKYYAKKILNKITKNEHSKPSKSNRNLINRYLLNTIFLY